MKYLSNSNLLFLFCYRWVSMHAFLTDFNKVNISKESVHPDSTTGTVIYVCLYQNIKVTWPEGDIVIKCAKRAIPSALTGEKREKNKPNERTSSRFFSSHFHSTICLLSICFTCKGTFLFHFLTSFFTTLLLSWNKPSLKKMEKKLFNIFIFSRNIFWKFTSNRQYMNI